MKLVYIFNLEKVIKYCPLTLVENLHMNEKKKIGWRTNPQETPVNTNTQDNTSTVRSTKNNSPTFDASEVFIISG